MKRKGKEKKGRETQVREGKRIKKGGKGMRKGRKGKRIEAKEGEWKGIERKEVGWSGGRAARPLTVGAQT
jgi:hypothetical protein